MVNLRLKEIIPRRLYGGDYYLLSSPSRYTP